MAKQTFLDANGDDASSGNNYLIHPPFRKTSDRIIQFQKHPASPHKVSLLSTNSIIYESMATLMRDPGETSLDTLLATLTATLHPTTYVFTTIPGDEELPPLKDVQLLFREGEGVTVVTSLEVAAARRMEYFFPSKMITLNVTSSLEAVGFMAVIATRLATRAMGVNPVSGFYHDHLFVPLGREEEAMTELKALAYEKSAQIGRN